MTLHLERQYQASLPEVCSQLVLLGNKSKSMLGKMHCMTVTNVLITPMQPKLQKKLQDGPKCLVHWQSDQRIMLNFRTAEIPNLYNHNESKLYSVIYCFPQSLVFGLTDGAVAFFL